MILVTAAGARWRDARGMEEEMAMTLTIIDPRAGTHVKIWYPDLPPVRQARPAIVVRHPRFAVPHGSGHSAGEESARERHQNA
ncbi:hypothetical protein [Methylobacterium nigriterrae]|uniref:hypothetical protein n=1 Tax=Methylobacterium nigriterrae TaxID=3127512 RepID=UPI00301325DF